MAKKSSIEREKKRERLVAKYADKREALLEEFKALKRKYYRKQPFLRLFRALFTRQASPIFSTEAIRPGTMAINGRRFWTRMHSSFSKKKASLTAKSPRVSKKAS